MIKKVCDYVAGLRPLPWNMGTFKEFLLDYATPKTRQIGEEAVLKHLELIGNPTIRRVAEQRLLHIDKGVRDLYF